MKLFSRGSEYAVRAMLHVLAEGLEARFSPGEVCRQTHIPDAYSRKVFRALVEGNILVARHGPNGGYALKGPLDKISLYDIVAAIDGEDSLDECPLGERCQAGLWKPGANPLCDACPTPGPSSCHLAPVCPFRDMWRDMKALMRKELRTNTLATIKEGLLHKNPGRSEKATSP